MLSVIKRGISKVKEDIKVIYDNDPAAKNLLEVILCYPDCMHLMLIALHTDCTNGIYH